MTNFFFLLPIALCLTFQPQLTAAYNYNKISQVPSGAPSSAPSGVEALLAKACERALHKNFCISLLKTDRNYNNTNLKGLAFIALKIAKRNTFETAVYIKHALQISPEEQPAEQEGLSECSGHYKSAVDLMDDAINALVSDRFAEVTTWVKAAVIDIDACDSYIKDFNAEVAKKDQSVRVIVNTALSVAHVYAKY